MANKHEKQRDFYKKMSEWKKELEVKEIKENEKMKKKNNKLVLSDAAFKGIKKTKTVDIYDESPEYRAASKEADKRILEQKHRNAKVAIEAQGFVCGTTQNDNER